MANWLTVMIYIVLETGITTALVNVPRAAVWCEHHSSLSGDVDDTVFRVDGHTTQLDILRISRANTRVLLHTGLNHYHEK